MFKNFLHSKHAVHVTIMPTINWLTWSICRSPFKKEYSRDKFDVRVSRRIIDIKLHQGLKLNFSFLQDFYIDSMIDYKIRIKKISNKS